MKRTMPLFTIIFLILSPSSRAQGVNTTGQIDREVRRLISELYQTPEMFITSATIVSSFLWVLALTEPMRKLIEIGPQAQKPLLEKLSDPAIKDQVMILLGGIGDERAIEPLIKAMVGKDDLDKVKNTRNVNLCANLALTNITFADVIFPYGRHAAYTEKCEGNAKECWRSWWESNRRTFSLKNVDRSRNHEFYPDYGIYTRPRKRNN